MFQGPRVTHMGPVPGSPTIAGYNPAKVTMRINRARDVYRGSIAMYQGWDVIQRTLVPGTGRVDIMISKGKRVAMLYSVRPTSISNELRR